MNARARVSRQTVPPRCRQPAGLPWPPITPDDRGLRRVSRAGLRQRNMPIGAALRSGVAAEWSKDPWRQPGQNQCPQRNRCKPSLPSGPLAPSPLCLAAECFMIKARPVPAQSSPANPPPRTGAVLAAPASGPWNRSRCSEVNCWPAHHRATAWLPRSWPHAGDPARRLEAAWPGACPMAPDCGPGALAGCWIPGLEGPWRQVFHQPDRSATVSRQAQNAPLSNGVPVLLNTPGFKGPIQRLKPASRDASPASLLPNLCYCAAGDGLSSPKTRPLRCWGPWAYT